MSFKLKNTEAYLVNYVKKLIVLTRQEIKTPRTRTYNSKLFGKRNITKPINSSGDLLNSLRLVKKLKNVVNEKGFRATSIQEIVEATSVNRFSLYHEFQNKEGILYNSLKLYQDRYGKPKFKTLNKEGKLAAVLQENQ